LTPEQGWHKNPQASKRDSQCNRENRDTGVNTSWSIITKVVVGAWTVTIPDGGIVPLEIEDLVGPYDDFQDGTGALPNAADIDFSKDSR
jgi:hypothetical protein